MDADKEVKSPCVGICSIRGGICRGCGRTPEQIQGWQEMTNEEKEEVMGKFKREERYIVVKIKDLEEGQAQGLRNLLAMNDVPTRECVVVEADWPIYEETWENVQRLAEGRPSIREGKIEALEHAADLGAALEGVIGEKWELTRKLDALEESLVDDSRQAEANVVNRFLGFGGASDEVSNQVDLDQLSLDTAQAISEIDPATLPGGKTRALAQAQNLIRDALQQVRNPA